MRQFGLLGYPLGHSMSPFIHQELFRLSGVEASYSLTAPQPHQVAQAIPPLFELDGFNITIPYKQTILPYLDRLDPSASRYQSVNTVVTGKNGGEKTGYNTDVAGFLTSLEWMGASLQGKVLLLGSGGAGRMMAVETLLAGGDLTLAVRDLESANTCSLLDFLEELFPEKTVKATTLSAAKGPYDLLLNATPVGMYPNEGHMPVSKEVLSRVSYVFDAVYNPERTLLVQTAAQMGATVQSGMAMLVWQAVKAQEIWMGSSFSPEQIRQLIASANRQMEEKYSHKTTENPSSQR